MGFLVLFRLSIPGAWGPGCHFDRGNRSFPKSLLLLRRREAETKTEGSRTGSGRAAGGASVSSCPSDHLGDIGSDFKRDLDNGSLWECEWSRCHGVLNLTRGDGSLLSSGEKRGRGQQLCL